MKPRTKLHHRVAELSSRLLRIDQNQKQWAFKECLPHKGYANKSSAFCLDCGETFSLELIKRKKAVCPHCKTKLTIEFTRKTTSEQTNYFAIVEVFGEFQVVRNFELNAHYKKGIPVKHYLHEILQYWIQPDSKTTMFGKLHTVTGYCDSWGGNWEIREENRRSWYGSKYDVYPRHYHPKSEFKKEYSKIGINHNLSGLTVLEAIKIIPNNPKAETLIKEKQFSLLGKMSGELGRVTNYWPSIKICLRNNYKVKDASIWMDYLDLLRYFNKDLHNAKYVCPKNLKLEHDRWMKKKREIIRLQEIERERLKIEKRQQNLEKAIVEYVERNKKFFDLEFTKGNITINVLQSVEEFKEEGDELKHCVYTNEYYLKEQSLILSAKVNGKRAETLEILLPDIKIAQSRGLNNKSTKHHEKIVDLVNKNLEKIRKIVIQSRPRGRKKSAA
jgi:DNA-directed RNA polymerase subunit RPC12/RpoP